MIYRHDAFPTGNLPLLIYNYLSNFISDLTYDSDTGTITFFDKFSFTTEPGAGLPTLTLRWGTNAISWGGGLGMGGTSDVYLIYGEDFMYLKICQSRENRWVVMSYVKIDENRYIVGGTLGDRPEPSFYNINYYDTSSAIVCKYNFPKVMPFEAAPGKIVYAEQSPLSYNDTDVVFVDSIYSCSTVPLRSTVSIGNDNYLAVDTNNLVLLDSE